MLDRPMRKLIDPVANRVGLTLAGWGLPANGVTLAGLAIGLGAALCVAMGWFGVALVLVLLSRVADGLDGAVARATAPTDFGGYLDIAADFLFYGALPLAFVIYDPAQNGIAGAFLLATFYFNGTTFLGFAILAEKHGMETRAQGIKTLYYSNGLLEGTETIAFFVLICLLPAHFAWMAYVFGGLCVATAVLRLVAARQLFGGMRGRACSGRDRG